MIDVLKEFPTSDIYISLEGLIQLKDEIVFYGNYRDAVEEAIINQASQQAENETTTDGRKLPDLRNQGSYSFTQKTINLKREEYRQTQTGFVSEYSFNIDFFVPQNTDKPSPLIFISHGFGSVRQNYTNLAQHLASYGFVVVIPEHVGSDLLYREELLRGELSSALSPVEYLDRPRDISFIIDRLEELVNQDSEWAKLINLEQIGIIGDSLGGTTVLSLAGASLNIPRLRQECAQENIIVNVSLILQCQASNLPPVEYNLQDNRVKAVIAAHPLTSAIFGAENMAQIKIPILMSAGSKDIVTPVVTEQIHPFIWLENPQKHLLLYQPGSHFSSSKPSAEFQADYLPEFLFGNNRDVSSRYFLSMAVAFMEVYLRENKDFLPYLSAGYGNFISQENERLNVSQINDLETANIINAYGGQLPFSIVPEKITVQNKSSEKSSIIEEIKNTGVLKIAYPRHAEPFGYLDKNGQWSGFCNFFGKKLAHFLEQELDLNSQLKVVVLPSNLQNRFNLVARSQVHLECGPNTITENNFKVNFSLPFFVTGTQFLVPQESLDNFNPNVSLAQFKIGVLKNTTTASFLAEKYPSAEAVYFEGINALDEAIEAIENKSLDAIIDDGILLENKLQNNPSLSQNYRIIPKYPLVCDYYGLLLPKDDRQWNQLVNKFVDRESLSKEYFPPSTYAQLAESVNYCLNF